MRRARFFARSALLCGLCAALVGIALPFVACGRVSERVDDECTGYDRTILFVSQWLVGATVAFGIAFAREVCAGVAASRRRAYASSSTAVYMPVPMAPPTTTRSWQQPTADRPLYSVLPPAYSPTTSV